MRISVDGDAALQNLLNNDPAGTQKLQQTIAAQNAKLNVNGIAITSPTNTVKEAIQGTTLTLVQTGTTGLSMKANTSSVTSAINDFVKAYNSLQSTAAGLTTYDADTKTGAALVGDSWKKVFVDFAPNIATHRASWAHEAHVRPSGSSMHVSGVQPFPYCLSTQHPCAFTRPPGRWPRW